MADVRDDGRDGVRDGALPYGVDTLVLRMEWPAPVRPQGYNGRMWRMRPVRGWSGGQAASEGLSGLDDRTAGPSTVLVTGSERVGAERGWAPAESLAQGSQIAAGVQYAQRGPPEEDEITRRPEPGGRALSDPELLRLELYNRLRSQLEEVDPGNPDLRKEYITGPEGFVPNQAEVDALGQALRGARSGGPTPQGPVNTFDNPGRPVEGDAVQNNPNDDGKGLPLPTSPSGQATTPSAPASPNSNRASKDSGNAPVETYPDGLAYRLNLPRHLSGPDGFKGNALSGTHNQSNAITELQNRGASYKVTPTGTPGINKLDYQTVDSNTGIVRSFTKTIYDPSIYSDQQILDMALRAGKRSFDLYRSNPTQTVIDLNEGGVNFRSYINIDKVTGLPYVGTFTQSHSRRS